MTHPILPTQEQFAKWDSEYFDEEGENGERQNFDGMMIKAFQSGADQQLEQVIKWAQRNCWCWFEKSNQAKSFAQELKKAMRPQEDTP